MDMCGQCLDEFAFLPYQYAIVEKDTSMVSIQEVFCSFACMKFWFEDEKI